MNKEIKINDYPCGSGKTTRMIENFKEDQKYLVILPMLTEVTRVILNKSLGTDELRATKALGRRGGRRGRPRNYRDSNHQGRK